MAIVRDISDRRRLEAEREHLRAIADREQERQRIAMNLHDGVIQSIYAAALNLEMAAEDVKNKPDEAVSEINRAIDQLNDTIRDLRVYILDLRPGALRRRPAGVAPESHYGVPRELADRGHGHDPGRSAADERKPGSGGVSTSSRRR